MGTDTLNDTKGVLKCTTHTLASFGVRFGLVWLAESQAKSTQLGLKEGRGNFVELVQLSTDTYNKL